MCGILGVASTDKINDVVWIQTGLNNIGHRGPDYSGTLSMCDQKVYFGHRRLSIIDLSNDANQPMVDDQSNNAIVFNGEIYNYLELKKKLINAGYKFKTNSDTEVLLKAYHYWGKNVTGHINGMFSFAIFDYSENILFLARDRAGEKPLFYSKIKNTFIFSSEIKSLLDYPGINKHLDIISFEQYLTYGYVNNDRTIIKEIYKLRPGHCMIFNLSSGKLTQECYWSLPLYNDKKYDEKDLQDELQRLLLDAVSKQLVSDVPLGILLSGGVDSSIITGIAASIQKKVNTYTVTFPGYKNYDETNHAKLLSDHFDTNHTELSATEITTDLISSLAIQYDEPLVDSSMIPTAMVCQLISKYCKVALGGDGGDELFGGYSKYNRLLQLKKFNFIPIPIKSFGVKISKYLPYGFKGRNWLSNLNIDLNNEILEPNGPFDHYMRSNLMKNDFNVRFNLYSSVRSTKYIKGDIVQKATRNDFYNYLSEDILVKTDRASMLHSLELRSPFLDYRVIEFAFSKVPSYLKVSGSSKKIILKNSYKNFLPNNFNYSRKQGFSIPLNVLLRKNNQIKEYVHDILLSHNSIFSPEIVNKLLLDHYKGYNNAERIFSLLIFEIWRNHYQPEII